MNAQEADGRAPEVEAAVEVVSQVRTTIVKLRGEHDLSTQARVTEALAAATAHASVLVDLSECTFADSSVVAALITASAEVMKRGGRLEVVIPPEARAVRRLAELARLADVVPIHETLRTVGAAREAEAT